jgi:hypothetical protein
VSADANILDTFLLLFLTTGWSNVFELFFQAVISRNHQFPNQNVHFYVQVCMIRFCKSVALLLYASYCGWLVGGVLARTLCDTFEFNSTFARDIVIPQSKATYRYETGSNTAKHPCHPTMPAIPVAAVGIKLKRLLHIIATAQQPGGCLAQFGCLWRKDNNTFSCRSPHVRHGRIQLADA